jgi:hypothetical protein
MKRPQFSLRLLLLIICLFAVIFGWQSAVKRTRQIQYASGRSVIEERVNHAEYLLKFYTEQAATDTDQYVRDHSYHRILQARSDLAKAREELEAIKP